MCAFLIVVTTYLTTMATVNYRPRSSQKRFKPPIKKGNQRTTSNYQPYCTTSQSPSHNGNSHSLAEVQLSQLNCGDLDDSLSVHVSIATPSNTPLDTQGETDCSIERCTQTHTVLSYCDNTCTVSDGEQMDVSEHQGNRGQVTSHMTNVFDIDEPLESSESEAEDYAIPSRFPRRQQTLRTYQYNFDSILHRNIENSRKKKNSKPAKKKRVQLVAQPNVLEYGGDRGCAVIGEGDQGRDLSVFDYQPTPQEGGANEGGGVRGVCGSKVTRSNVSKLDESVCVRSREEQLAIDREVIKVIIQTRAEIKALRSKYASRKANTGSSSLYQFTRPHSRPKWRTKPPLDVTISHKERGSAFNESSSVYCQEE